MTAARNAVIRCDWLDCTRTYTGGERIWAVRRQAHSDGWVYVGKRKHLDLCPDHANPKDGWIPLSRHVITSVSRTEDAS